MSIWTAFDEYLIRILWPFDQILMNIWSDFDQILWVFDQILMQLWSDFDEYLIQFWWLFDLILIRFRLVSISISFDVAIKPKTIITNTI